MISKIAIIGAGAFGYAMAKVVGDKPMNKELYLYDINKEWIDYIDENREHPIFHKNAKLSKRVGLTVSLKKAIVDADLIILAVPSKFLRGAMKDMKPFLKDNVIFLNLAKGLEIGTDLRLSEIIFEVLETDVHHIGCLSGGMIAREVTLGNPLCADIAFDNVNVAREVEKIVTNKTLRFDISSDVIGVEYAGALKNVIAIGAGIFDGLEYMESSKSAYVSYMAKEIKNLALFLEAREETFSLGSQAWLGDLMTTCFGGSRNLEFGSLIGKGHKPEEAMEIMTKERKSVEGYLTIKVAKELSEKAQIKTPLLDGLYDVVHGDKDPKDYVDFVINCW